MQSVPEKAQMNRKEATLGKENEKVVGWSTKKLEDVTSKREFEDTEEMV